MSKFEFEWFDNGVFAINSNKYNREKAIEIFQHETDYSAGQFEITKGFVRHRAGRNVEGECCVGWWVEDTEHSRSCPVWLFERKL